MPHKRSKQSVRQADRNARGKDLPPKTNDVELRDMPKGAMRILNGAKVQEDFHRKRKEQRAEMMKRNKNKNTNFVQSPNGCGDDGDQLKIKAGEKLGDFHRRVEKTMASNIHATIKSSQRSNKKRKENDTLEGVERLRHSSDVPSLAKQNDNNSDRDWQAVQQKRRLNDVVDAPPVLTKAPRGMLAPSLRRRAELEQERERAIKAYRLLKEKKVEQQQQQQQQQQS